MISITRLACDKSTYGDSLRYARPLENRKPIVVWNCTLRCNLKCVHCYAKSCSRDYDDELSTYEAKEMIRDLAAYGAPVLLFSGGEPLLREDLFELGSFARELGMRTVISTNGTLITKPIAQKIQDAGFSYVGISLDGVQSTNDRFRGVKGAFDAATRGIENCISIGQKVGLRLTMTRDNVQELPEIFDIIERMNIPRACFYHLVYTGRGAEIMNDDMTREQARNALDLIIDRALDMHRRGLNKDILTVDNHCDGPYLYMKMLKDDPERAQQVYELLRRNGGNSSGIAISCIDNVGEVHPDQFWRDQNLGNIRNRPFSQIWEDISNPVMAGLKNRKNLLQGRCAAANCRWLDICNGNFRARANAVYGDPWAQDPACYLTDDEISIRSHVEKDLQPQTS